MARESNRDGGSGEAVGIVPSYEGPEVLTSLLAQAGSPHGADEVAERFARARLAGESRSEVIPGLFPDEPRFGSPEAARRLYGNLFGLWDRIAAGLGAADDTPEPLPEPAAAPLPPERGSLEGEQLTTELVEATWRHLAALPESERQRLRDRFEQAQPDLFAWLDQIPVPEAGALAATDLVFEAWTMFDLAFGDRLESPAFRELQALEGEPPPLESEQPALAGYAAEQLDILADEDPAFDPGARAQVERILATASAALTRAVEDEADGESDPPGPS